ncbi:hypothetical protein NRB20_31480 [Nocardia sp. RB20]|uniref:Uncharacterized protein n=1 Tax=Nocardia macrotermitis TaxID=2585198 RepID=A0A7K0D2U8_9NOCA|nr:hypothetical protein [Nocardia macrotermitis]
MTVWVMSRASMLWGKPGSKALTSASRVRWVGSNSTVSAPRLSSSWSEVRAPMMGAVTAGFWSVQARATWAGVLPRAWAAALG